ncbi:MAG: DUF370 domain-containing protein [Oscillospiraceae bacterium]|nr:DUF370 domain-containing protein [Oscillospiraceae bacterium]MDY2846687.1 DUF370 domain-containing protein [Oscillospiraceae bacterium]
MYIHLGNENCILGDSVIGIFDIENTSVGKITKEFLSAAEKRGNTEYVSYEMPKAYVVCDDKDYGEKVYVTQVSPLTLRRRANSN